MKRMGFYFYPYTDREVRHQKRFRCGVIVSCWVLLLIALSAWGFFERAQLAQAEQAQQVLAATVLQRESVQTLEKIKSHVDRLRAHNQRVLQQLQAVVGSVVSGIRFKAIAIDGGKIRVTGLAATANDLAVWIKQLQQQLPHQHWQPLEVSGVSTSSQVVSFVVEGGHAAS